MLKTLLILPFLLVLACGSSTAPVPNVMNGMWCPVDSLTEYIYEQPVGTVYYSYLSQPGNGGYSLTLFEGTATPAGVYKGTFQRHTDDSILVNMFTLPRSPGTFFQAHGHLVFRFPESDVPWFWATAKHGTDARHIWTNLDDYGPGKEDWAVHLRLTWAPCYPT